MLWKAKRSALVAATTVQTISSYDRLLLVRERSLSSSTGGEGSTPAAAAGAAILERYRSIIEALYTIDRSAHERGVAYVVNTIVVDATDTSDGERITKLAGLLGRDDAATAAASPSLMPHGIVGKNGGWSSGMGEMVGAALTIDPLSIGNSLLPARVALETADASMRLDAIVRLREEAEGNVEDADLGRALLRRLTVDDSVAVASASGAIVASRLQRALVGEEGRNDSLIGDVVFLAKEALVSLLHWTYIGKDDDWSPVPVPTTDSEGKVKKGNEKSTEIDDVPCPLLSCISICGSVARLIVEQDSIDEGTTADLFHEIFLSLGAHVIVGSQIQSEECDPSYVLRDASSKAASIELLQLFNNDGAITTVTELITRHHESHKVLTHLVSGPQNK